MVGRIPLGAAVAVTAMTRRVSWPAAASRLRAPVILCTACLASFAPTAATGQQALSLDAFDGWETWPLLRPGDLEIDSGSLRPLRIEFDGLFPGPNGFGAPPLVPLTMYMDVLPERFHGAPALWIQWTSKPRPERSDAPALDALIVDRVTFRLLFRIAASGRGDWAGDYEVIQARPDGVLQTGVREDGTTNRHELTDSDSTGFFDFATYPFLFPFLDLREGRAFRLSGYDYLEKRAEILPARVMGRTTVKDAGGRSHEVWRVDVMPAHRATLISFYVSKAPPFFYGWDYRLTRDGSTAIKLTLRGWTSTSVESRTGSGEKDEDDANRPLRPQN